MTDRTNYRWDRIKRLLDELKYEVTRGMMEGEVDESIGFRFIVPISKSIKDGVVQCEFRTRPIPRGHIHFVGPDEYEPRLKVVK